MLELQPAGAEMGDCGSPGPGTWNPSWVWSPEALPVQAKMTNSWAAAGGTAARPGAHRSGFEAQPLGVERARPVQVLRREANVHKGAR